MKWFGLNPEWICCSTNAATVLEFCLGANV